MNVQAFLQTLPYMLKGLLGVFTVTLAIMLSIWVLNKLTSGKGGNGQP